MWLREPCEIGFKFSDDLLYRRGCVKFVFGDERLDEKFMLPYVRSRSELCEVVGLLLLSLSIPSLSHLIKKLVATCAIRKAVIVVLVIIAFEDVELYIVLMSV